MAVTCSLPSTDQNSYQNVPQNMNFDIFDVPKKITLAKFGFWPIMYNRVMKK